jgi:membrane-associated protease RseP (regulator of RpoE activity)
MAQSVVRYLSPPEHRQMKMVVLSGGFHVSFGFGIPRRVFRRMPDPYSIVLPYTARLPEGKEYAAMPNVSPVDIPLPIADFVWAVPYDDLEGKGVRLGVGIEPSDKGVLVRSVTPESPAEKAGIQPGDIITDFGDEPILEPFDLIYLIKQKRAGDTATAKVLRGDKMVNIDVEF